MSDDSVLAMSAPQQQNRPRLNWELNLGNMVQILLIAVGLGYYIIKGEAKQESTALAVVNLERRVDQGFAAVNGRIDELARAVSPIATLNSRLTEAERRLTEQDARDNRQDERMGRVEQDIAGIRAQLEVEARPGRRVVPR